MQIRGLKLTHKGGEGSGWFAPPEGTHGKELKISSYTDHIVFHGTSSSEAVERIRKEGLKPGASIGMSGQAPKDLPFVYVSPSERVAKWYAENNIRGQGKVVKGKFTGRVADETYNPMSEFGAMVSLAEKLGQDTGPDKIVDMKDLAIRMRSNSISAIAFRDIYAKNRLSWIVLPEATNFKK